MKIFLAYHPKAGSSFGPFIDNACGVVVDHPGIMASVFDINDFKRDCQLWKDLSVIVSRNKELAESVGSTLMTVNSDALMGALEVYAAAKLNANKVPGLNVASAKAGQFFKKSKKPTAKT